MNNLKQCLRCKQWKEKSEFCKNKRKKDGHDIYCRQCTKRYRQANKNKITKQRRAYYQQNKTKCLQQVKEHYIRNRNAKLEYARQYRSAHKNEIKEVNKKWRIKNKNYIKEKGSIYYSNNKSYILEREKLYRKAHPKKIKKKDREQYQKHKEKKKISHKLWCKKNKKRRCQYAKNYHEKNKEKLNAQRRDYENNRLKTDIKFRLKKYISFQIRSKLKKRLIDKNGKSTFDFLPYTVDELKKHLESLFKPWMNWNNYGNKKGNWSIDHIIADYYFNYMSVEDKEFQECWALENLRPFDAIENIKKSNKLNYDEVSILRQGISTTLNKLKKSPQF